MKNGRNQDSGSEASKNASMNGRVGTLTTFTSGSLCLAGVPLRVALLRCQAHPMITFTTIKYLSFSPAHLYMYL
ncbi:hypothetical protein K503DRAFT_768669 [Rhizopogon vinicolor AM-OR11-026]|uniref:Uncharacterized protein n=1 Tax=Rhizopogon vinicolor AM-OR11-026 TaxID=1314800 RepID=A0A1B7N689_9AGAM|nr:hypothetical protein K503DRAFT_768669 [Rhizopogon vinicolor AM-OR11-026]